MGRPKGANTMAHSLFAADAIAKSAASATISADSVLRGTRSGQFPVESAKKATSQAGFGVDADLKATRMGGFATTAVFLSPRSSIFTVRASISLRYIVAVEASFSAAMIRSDAAARTIDFTWLFTRRTAFVVGAWIVGAFDLVTYGGDQLTYGGAPVGYGG